MKYDELLKSISDLHIKRVDLLIKKGKDYANEDALSNFKRVGKILDVFGINEFNGEYVYLICLIILKIDRILNLIKRNAAPNNESIEDSIIDLHNYIDLFNAVLNEGKSMEDVR